MYERYYRLTRAPFDIAPNPAFLFATPAHSEALATIAYGIEKRKGFVVLTGEVGLGKTTLLRAYLDQADRAGLDLVYVLHPAIEFKDLLVMIAEEIGLALTTANSLFELIDAIQHRLIELYRAGRNMEIIIDEAQRLPESTLENLRLLSNLETEHDKLIQIVLVGQPELDAFLGRPEMRQLAQRVALRARLKPLDVPDAVAYLQHRLRMAGARHPEKIMSAQAMRRLAEESGGVPRTLNILADNTLITGFALQRMPVGAAVVDDVVREYFGRPSRPSRARRLVPAAIGLGVAAAAALALGFYGPDLVDRARDWAGSGRPQVAEAEAPMLKPAPPMAVPRADEEKTARGREPLGSAGSAPPAAANPPPAVNAGDVERRTPPAPFETVETPKPPPSAEAPASGPEAEAMVSLPPAAAATAPPPAVDVPPPSALSPAREPPPGSPVPPPAALPTNLPGETSEVVKAGDTLYRLVLDHYGVWNERTRDLVLRRNPAVTNGNVLWVGQVLNFPPPPPDLASAASARIGTGKATGSD